MDKASIAGPAAWTTYQMPMGLGDLGSDPAKFSDGFGLWTIDDSNPAPPFPGTTVTLADTRKLSTIQETAMMLLSYEMGNKLYPFWADAGASGITTTHPGSAVRGAADLILDRPGEG